MRSPVRAGPGPRAVSLLGIESVYMPLKRRLPAQGLQARAGQCEVAAAMTQMILLKDVRRAVPDTRDRNESGRLALRIGA